MLNLNQISLTTQNPALDLIDTVVLHLDRLALFN